MLAMHGDWKRLKDFDLIGTLDDNDVDRIMQIVSSAQYKKIPANHVIHAFKPKEYVESY